MRDCGNCGYWEFKSIENRFAMGMCHKSKGPHNLEITPYSLHEDCWEPEGGRGPFAEIPPPELVK